MKKQNLSALLFLAGLAAYGQSNQIQVSRIEQMPSIPAPYEMRDWKQVTEKYVDLVFSNCSGEYMPLSSQDRAGVNYPQYNPIYMDTYVGWTSHGDGSEAINVMPAVVSACLNGCQQVSDNGLANGVLDFYNLRNGENVYLNNFSSKSGSDWWYDVMPNIYFYQLYHLTDLPQDIAGQQFVSVADRWLEAVYALGGNTFLWNMPNMNYRAFDLISGEPLDSGVKEPESAGSIAWILYNAYIETGDVKYRKGAELALDFLNSLTSNPAYELQLAYGVQTAAKMNAIEGTDYDIEKMFNWCFDRGPLRGWGCIVGNWGGYDVSGLIGEANDGGDDYAFVMNGFQQAAALAPVARYDKRFARAYARWMLNLANASRLFYPGALPDDNQEPASLEWSRQYDADAAIPYESIKEKWEGKNPYAMGDAVKGGWAATNLSLYSGSSVGYLAAVVNTTDVEAILQLNLNSTDLDGKERYASYLYYNPYTDSRKVTVSLPEGTWRVYDAITESSLAESVSGTYSLEIPADEVRLITLIPSDVTLSQNGRRLMAGDEVIDYHYNNDFDATLRIRNTQMQSSYLVHGQTAVAKATVQNASAACTFAWYVDGVRIEKQSTAMVSFTADMANGEHTLRVEVSDGGVEQSDSVTFMVSDSQITVPVIEGITIAEAMPLQPLQSVNVALALQDKTQQVDIVWSADGGNVVPSGDGSTAVWSMPDGEGLYTLTCTVSNVRGSVSGTCTALVRRQSGDDVEPMLQFAFDSSLDDVVSGEKMSCSNGSPVYTSDAFGRTSSALAIDDNFFYLENSDALNFRDAITISMWVSPQRKNGLEQFLISHGSWQDRYKLSINPDMTVRWTVKTDNGVVDLDYSEPLQLNTYEHFCVTYTGFSLELYHNGELYSYKPLSGAMGTTSQNLTLGAMTMDDQNYNFEGAVDELVIFDKVLSLDQIRRLAGQSGSSAIDDVESSPVYTIEDGYVHLLCSVDDFKAYSVAGMDVTGTRLTCGVYIFRYVKNGIIYTDKVVIP